MQHSLWQSDQVAKGKDLEQWLFVDVNHKPRRCVHEMTAVGFEPTPLRTGALSQRLRPLGQTVLSIHPFHDDIEFAGTSTKENIF